MKKRLISFFLALALMACPVHALEGESLRAANDLSALGLVQGTPEGYALEAGATRAQALVLLARMTALPKNDTALAFTDVPIWAEESVRALSAAGYLEGIYAPPTLYSSEFITADEWSALLLRCLGYSYPKEGAQTAAVRLGVLPRAYTSPLSRADLFQMTRDALNAAPQGKAPLVQRLAEQGICSSSAARELGLLDNVITAREAADRHMAAVCQMQTFAPQEDPEDLEDGQEEGPKEDVKTSSAFFLTPDGIAVTNHHSLEGAETAAVTLITGETFPVEGVLWSNEEADLALIRVSRTVSGGLYTVPAFACLTAVSPADAYPGDVVYALGNPLGLGHFVSSGVIGAVDRGVTLSDLPCIVSSADISTGSSGGALLNEYGHVIAVTSGAFINGNGLFISVPLDLILQQNFAAMTLRPITELNETED